MSRRWMRLGVPALALAVAAASVILVAATFARQATVTGWVASHQLAPGAVIAASDVRQVSVATGADAFSLSQSSPVGSRTTHTIGAGDLIRPDDVATKLSALVPITLKVAPPLSPGSSLDVYALPAVPSPGGLNPGAPSTPPSPVLIARGVPVITPGPPTVISVPAETEPLWMSLISSQTELLATLSTGVSVPAATTGYPPTQAIQILSQLAQGQPAPPSGP